MRSLKLRIGIEDLYVYALSLFLIWKFLFTGVAWQGKLLSYANLIFQLCSLVVPFFLVCSFVKRFRRGVVIPWIYVLIIGLLFISSRTTGDSVLIYSAIFVILAYGLSFDRISKTYLNTLLLCLSVLVVGCLSGVIADKTIEFSYGVGHSLGLAHPNNLAALVMNISLVASYRTLMKNEKKWVSVAIGLVVTSIAVNYITHSRTTTICLICYAIFIVIYRLLRVIKFEALINTIKVAALLLILGSIYLMTHFANLGSSLTGDVNAVVRFSNAYSLYKQYGIHLFGSAIEFIGVQKARSLGVSSVVLDSAYPNLLIYHGVVAFVIFFLFVVFVLRKTKLQKDNYLQIIILIFLMSGIMEQNVFMVQCDFVLLYLLAKVDTNNVLN